MADIESKIILKANSTEAVKNIKELTDTIEICKEKLLKLDADTKEYNLNLQKLAESLGKVNEISAGAGAALTNLSGGIYTLKESVAGYAELLLTLTAGTEEYKDTLENLAGSLGKINQINEEANTTLLNLSGGMAAFQDSLTTYAAQLVTLQTGTEEYDGSLESLVESLGKIKEVNKEANTTLLNLSEGMSVLKEEVTAYTTQLISLEAGTEEYTVTLQNLIESQEKIKEIQTEVNTTLLDLTDGMSVSGEEIIIHTERMAELETGTEKYTLALEKLAESQEKGNAVNTKAKDTVAILKDGLAGWRKEVETYTEELSQLDRGTEDYIDTLNSLVETQGKIEELNSTIEVANMDLVDSFSHLTSIAGDVVSGFEAVSQVTEMLGGDNEALSEALGKVQAGMALAQQLGTLMKGIKAANLAFKAFNITLYSNPILAIVGAAALLTAGLVALFKVLGKNEEQTKKLNKAQEDYNDTVKKLNRENSRELELEKARGATAQQLIDLERKQIQIKRDKTTELIKEYESYKKLNKEQKQNLENLKKELELLDKADYDLDTKEEANKIKQDREEQEEEDRKREDAAKKRQQKIEQENAKKLAEQEAFSKAEESAAKTHAEILAEIEREKQRQITDAYGGKERLEFLQQEMEVNQKLQSDLLAAYTNEELTWQEREKAAKDYQQALIEGQMLTEEFKNLQQEISDKEKEDLAMIEELNNRSFSIRQEQEEQKLLWDATERERQEQQLWHDEKELERNKEKINQLELDLQNEELTNERRIELLQEYNEALENQAELEGKISQAKKKLSDEDIKVKEANYKATVDFLNDSASELGENTIAGKALGVASATISTYTGAAQVLSNPTQLNPYAKWAQFAATIATGLSAVKNILSTDVPGAADSVSANTSSPVSLPSIPEMSSDFVETHNNMDGYDEEVFSQQPVLVVEDVNQVQNRVRVAEGESTF